MRVTVGTIVGLIASGATHEEILTDYPYLDADDIEARPVQKFRRRDLAASAGRVWSVEVTVESEFACKCGAADVLGERQRQSTLAPLQGIGADQRRTTLRIATRHCDSSA